jgi:hypothetical protein
MPLARALKSLRQAFFGVRESKACRAKDLPKKNMPGCLKKTCQAIQIARQFSEIVVSEVKAVSLGRRRAGREACR